MVSVLSNLDFALIVIYFIVLIIIGYITSRKQKQEDFLIAERKVNTFSTMATINASKTGAILMTFVAFIYLWGFSAIWYFIGMVTGILVFLPFALKLKENSNKRFYTLADYFRYNYGNKIAKLVSLVTIFIMFGFLVINLIGGAKIFILFTGWPFWVCTIIMVIVILIYLLMGGFKAVVKTDIIQYCAMVFILIVLVFVLFNGALIPTSEWNLFQADTAVVIGFFLVGVLFPFAMPDMWQRVYSAKNKRILKKGLLLSSAMYALVGFFLGLVALTVKVKFPGIDPDLALVHGFANLLPSGLLGLGIVLLFAAVMSSADTFIFTGASAIVQDFFRLDKQETIKKIRKVIFILAVVGTIVAILIEDLVLSSYIFAAFIIVLAICVFATWIRNKIKQSTLLIGFVIGVLVTIFLLIYSSLFLGGITPALVAVALLSTIVGLIIGGIIGLIKK